MNIIHVFKSDLPFSKKLLFVWKSLTVWPYWSFKIKHQHTIQSIRWVLSQKFYQVQRLWKLTRDNMTAEEMAADDKVWADWFQDRSWEAMMSPKEQRPALKARIDFMAKQRIIGVSFPMAEKAFAKAGGAA